MDLKTCSNQFWKEVKQKSDWYAYTRIIERRDRPCGHMREMTTIDATVMSKEVVVSRLHQTGSIRV